MYKERNTGDQPVGWEIVQHDLSGHVIGSYGGVYSEPPQYTEYIEWENGGRNSFNPCLHFKRSIKNHSLNSFEVRTLSDHIQYQTNAAYSLGTTCPWNVVPEPPGPELGERQFILRAFQRAIPKLKADVSVPNFLFELKDLLHTFPTPERVHQLADICRLAIGNPFRASKKFHAKRRGILSGRGALSELKDELAQQHLSANFGYLPLINDVFNIISGSKEFNLRLSEFKKKISRDNLFHWSESAPDVETGRIAGAVSPGDRIEYTIAFSNVKWHCTLRGQLSADLKKLSIPTVLRKYYGFRSNPRILWDAIPYSFLVDWVSSFGKFLETYDKGAIPATLRVFGVGLSVSYRAKMTVYFVDSSNTYSFDEKEIGTVEWSCYKRWPVESLDLGALENLPPLPTLHGLSLNQVTLGAGLVNNFVGKSPHKR